MENLIQSKTRSKLTSLHSLFSLHLPPNVYSALVVTDTLGLTSILCPMTSCIKDSLKRQEMYKNLQLQLQLLLQLLQPLFIS